MEQREKQEKGNHPQTGVDNITEGSDSSKADEKKLYEQASSWTDFYIKDIFSKSLANREYFTGQINSKTDNEKRINQLTKDLHDSLKRNEVIGQSPDITHACNTLHRNRKRIASDIVTLYSRTEEKTNSCDESQLEQIYSALLKQLEIDTFHRTASNFKAAAIILTILGILALMALIGAIALTTMQVPGSIPYAIRVAEFLTTTLANTASPALYTAIGISSAAIITDVYFSCRFFYEASKNRGFANNRESAITADEKQTIATYRA